MKSRRKSVLIFGVIGTAVCFFMLGDSDPWRIQKSGGVLAFLLLLSGLINFTQTRKKQIQQSIEKGMAKSYPGGVGAAGLVGKRTFSIYQEGISFLTDSDFEQKSWGSLAAITLQEDAIFVFSTPVTYHFIPKNKVGDEEFLKITNVLRETVPPNITRTKFDYPLQ